MSRKNVVIFGATGMIGSGALLEALDDPRVERVLSVGRRTTGRTHSKLEEITNADFSDLSAHEPTFAEFDTCLFCLGVSSAGMSEADYRRITYDYSVVAGEALLRANTNMTLCFISGSGTDASSSTMWKRIKGEAENAMLEMPWKAAHMFRPAAIVPRRGVVSGVMIYRITYALLGWTYGFWKLVAPNMMTTTDQLGRALLNVGFEGHEKAILEGVDINAVCD